MRGVALSVVARPVDLGVDVEVAGPGERRDPPPVDEVGVPAHVVQMEVGVHNEVDGGRVEPRLGEALQERPVLVVPERHLPGFAVADAGIDHHGAVTRLDHEGLDPQTDAALAVGVPGDQPSVAPDPLFGGCGEEEGRWDVVSLGLHDAGDARAARLPAPGSFCHETDCRQADPTCTSRADEGRRTTLRRRPDPDQTTSGGRAGRQRRSRSGVVHGRDRWSQQPEGTRSSASEGAKASASGRQLARRARATRSVPNAVRIAR